MKTAWTIILVVITMFAFSQHFEIEYSTDSTLETVEIYYIFIDTLTNKLDSHLYQKREYSHGLLKETVAPGHSGYSSITSYSYYPNTTNLYRSIERTLYHGHDSAVKVVVYHYDNFDNNFFALYYDSSSTHEYVRFDINHNIYNSKGKIEREYWVSTNGPTYNTHTTIYQYDKHGQVIRELINNPFTHDGKDTLEIIYLNTYDKTGKLITCKRVSIGNFYKYENDKEIVERRDTITDNETKYYYYENGMLFKQIHFTDVSVHPVKNVGQNYQKDILD